ncbi:MAG: class I SAM-dependent methyltransferase [Ferruginibacter sp.]
MIHLSSCPLCHSTEISEVLQVKDFTVSGESFPVFECHICTGRFTNDIPTQAEIGKYYQAASYISHSDARGGIVNTLYHFFRSLTVKSKREMVKKYCKLRTGSLLDIGSGTGVFLNEMKKHDWKISGLEPDEKARERAASLHQVKSLEPEAIYSLHSETFDAVTMWHVLEHVHDIEGYLKQVNKSLKEKGKFFIAVPNYTSADAVHYKQFWAAYDVPRHLYHFSPGSMKKLLSANGFTLQAMVPLWLDSYYVSILSEKYKTGKENLVTASMVGSRSNAAAMLHTEKCSSVLYIAGKKIS